MESLGKWIAKLYPMVLGIIVSYIFYKLGVDYQVPNFEKVLDNTTIFSSIVVGFLGALLGILVSIKDSEIVEAIFKSSEKGTLKSYFNESFIIGLSVVIVSSVMQVVRDYVCTTSLIIFHLWLFLAAWFIPATYRIISILMKVFFKSHVKDSRVSPDEPNNNNPTEIKNRLKNNKKNHKE